MNKIATTLFLFLFAGASTNAQVGINTTSPVATMDVTASSTTTKAVEGLIAPRLVGDDLATATDGGAYGSQQVGTMVYVTLAPTVTLSSAMHNVTNPGYYYWDGSTWLEYLNTTSVMGSFWRVEGNSNVTGGSTGIIGTTDNTPLNVETNGQPRMSVAPDGSISLGSVSATTSLAPILVSNDATKITLPNLTDGANLYPLGINDNGVLFTQGKVGYSKPFKYIEMRLDYTDGTQVTDFDTEIDASKYFINLAGLQSNVPGSSTIPLTPSGNEPVTDAVAFIAPGTTNTAINTWHLRLQYDNSPNTATGTYGGQECWWTVYLFVVPTRQITDMAPAVDDMGGALTKTAASSLVP